MKIEAWVKQGKPLSATLFSLVVHTILKQRDLGGNISTRLKQSSTYADDIEQNNHKLILFKN